MVHLASTLFFLVTLAGLLFALEMILKAHWTEIFEALRGPIPRVSESPGRGWSAAS